MAANLYPADVGHGTRAARRRLAALATACVLALLAAGFAASAASSQELTPGEQQLLREAHAAGSGGTPEANRRRGEGARLAREFGRADRQAAIPFLLKLQDRSLLFAFAETYRAPASPELEALVIDYLGDTALGTCSAALLVRNYRSRALYEALLAAINSQVPNHEYCVRAIVRTELPGIEADITAIMPRLADYYALADVAGFLVARNYLPAEPALIDWLAHTAPRNLGSVAWIIVKLGSPGLLNAMAQRLAGLKGLPPGGDMDSSLDGLLSAMLYASPHLKLDRSLFSPELMQSFAPVHRAKITAMLEKRTAVERMADEITPANFAHWIASGRSDMVRNFIQRGADVNAMEATSRDYPLHCAAKSSHWEAFGLLLDAGAKPNPRDWQGATPLKLIAGRKAHVASLDLPTLVAARRLLDKGADPTAASADTMTPLHVATANRFDPMVRLLVESGAAINAEAVEEGFLGLTPTQIADDHDYAEIAAFLRSKGGKTNATFVAKRAAQRAYIKLIGPFLYQ